MNRSPCSRKTNTFFLTGSGTAVTVGVLLVMGVLGSGCAGYSSRSVGGSNSPVIPVFQGEPPTAYPYRNLGRVEGKYTTDRGLKKTASQAYVVSQGLRDLAQKASDLGANAVIRVKREPGEGRQSHSFRFVGEAVVFERLPSE